MKLAAAVFVILSLLPTAGMAGAQTPVTVTLVPKAARAIPADFAGLSFETSALLPDTDGQHVFRSTNLPLINTFRSLGIRNLRIGGNSVDQDAVPIPSNADIDNLFDFAQAANVKVIYSLRLKSNNPAAGAAIAKYVMEHYSTTLDCLSIGNEPNMYIANSSTYNDEFAAYRTAILAISPNAKLCGPSPTPGKPDWAVDFARHFAHAREIHHVLQHEYFGGNGQKVTGAEARDKLLAPAMLESYENVHARLVPAVRSDGFDFRFEETNNYFHGGSPGASNTFASALWGLEYMLWWAAHDVSGLNFHTNIKGSGYSLFGTSANGYAARPLGYGMKAFSIAGNGRSVPAKLANPQDVNLTAYGTSAGDGTLYVTFINKEHDSAARSADVTIVPGAKFAQGQVIFLTAPNNDVAATSGILLGGAPLMDDGSWNGSWTNLPVPSHGRFKLTIPQATAAIVKLTVKRID
jgi:hypothetical protein